MYCHYPRNEEDRRQEIGPLSLTPIIGQMLEPTVKKVMEGYLDNSKKNHTELICFRKGDNVLDKFDRNL